MSPLITGEALRFEGLVREIDWYLLGHAGDGGIKVDVSQVSAACSSERSSASSARKRMWRCCGEIASMAAATVSGDRTRVCLRK